MYNLKPSDFTNGRYGLVTESGPMVTATDTYNIGRMAYLAEDMEATADWMGETLRIIGNESSQGNSPDRLLVLDHLAFAEFKVYCVLCTGTACTLTSFRKEGSSVSLVNYCTMHYKIHNYTIRVCM